MPASRPRAVTNIPRVMPMSGLDWLFPVPVSSPRLAAKMMYILRPMVLNVHKDRDRVLTAYAVDTEMPGFKDNHTQVRVIAGSCQPFHPAPAICIDRIQITGLFFISAPLSCLFADADPFSIHSFCLFVFIQISFVSPDADVILLFCF